jgi:hypothetical protein
LIRLKVIVAVMALLAAGCGYSSDSLIASHYKTISLEIFKNETRYRDFEFILAEALKNEIVQKTDLKLASRSEAQTVLRGTIKSFEQYVVTETKTDQVRELEVKIVLSFQWVDQRTGRVIHERGRFQRTADAKFPLGQTRESAELEVLTDVAEDIINDLEKEW